MIELTAQQRRICETLAQKYPSSAASSGGAPLRLRLRASFPELETSSPDEKESFIEAAESLEKENIISLVWEKYRKGEEIKTIVLTNPQLMYRALGKPFPDSEAEQARIEALRAADICTPADTRIRNFFLWAADNIRPSDVRCSNEPYSEAELPSEQSSGSLSCFIRDLSCLLNALDRYARAGVLETVTVRSLSIQLFSDSKRIEKITAQASPFFRRAQNDSVEPPDISSVIRSYPDTMISGSASFSLIGGSVISNEGGSVLGLPFVTARKITAVSAHGRKILTIENKESFFALSSSPESPYSLFLYTGGHPNSAVQSVLRACAASGYSFYHAGDLDPDGILIMQEIADIVQCRVTPVKMDDATFDAYFAHTRLLDSSSLERVSLISDDVRSIPSIEKLLTRILETGRALEQEVIRYF